MNFPRTALNTVFAHSASCSPASDLSTSDGHGWDVTQDKVVRFDDRVRVGVTFSLPAGPPENNPEPCGADQAGGATVPALTGPGRVTAPADCEIGLERARGSGSVYDWRGTGRAWRESAAADGLPNPKQRLMDISVRFCVVVL